jgi:hypothetical protein
MRQRRALVVRIWLDEDGRLHGQLSDPLSDWKRPFHDPAQLWTYLQTFLVSPATNVIDDQNV